MNNRPSVQTSRQRKMNERFDELFIAGSNAAYEEAIILGRPTLGKRIEGETKFFEQAKCAARMLVRLAQANQWGREDFSVIDLGCGGSVGDRFYAPYFLVELSARGLSKRQLFGIDVAAQLSGTNEYYNHLQDNIVHLSGRVSAALDPHDTFLGELINRARENAKDRRIMITSNNLLGNADPTLQRMYQGTYYDQDQVIFRGFRRLMIEGDHIVTFDAPLVGLGLGIPMVLVMKSGRLVRSQYSKKFEKIFLKRFPYVDSS